MRGILAIAAASVACALGALAQAPPPPAAELALPPRYEVEIIVFANRELDPTEERFDHAPHGFLADPDAALRDVPIFDDTALAPPLDALAPVDPPAPLDPFAAERAEALRVRVLRPEELKLGNEYRRLQALAAYEPLVHAGWVLPGLPESDAAPFELRTLGVLNPRGTVKVHLSRFLHITLDLTYQAGTAAAPVGSFGDGLDEIVVAPQYRLAATRSARSNELHYFDHPAFGVLVRVTPVPTPGGEGRPAA